MKIKNDYKKYIMMGLCSVLIVMAVGYAAFSSLLTINGTATLSNSFCVGFDNPKLNTYAPTAGNCSSGTATMSAGSYETNRSLLEGQETWFNNHFCVCFFGIESSDCGCSSMHTAIYSNGSVAADISEGKSCYIGSKGESYCHDSNSGDVPV